LDAKKGRSVLWVVFQSHEYKISRVLTFYWVLHVYFLYTIIMIQVKRWHDRNKSGAWALINLIPIIGLWAIVENGFLRGNRESNIYGEPQT
jgi:uncharacterized membrane protein YhaH (DUF805 family)